MILGKHYTSKITIINLIIIKIMQDPIAEFIHWYKTRPIITKTFLTLSTIQAILLSLELLNIHSIYYTFEQLINTMQLWRPFTSLIYLGNLSFNFILQAYFAYFALLSSEGGTFEKQHIADYWILVAYLFTMTVGIASIFDIYFLSDTFLFGLIYVWCKIKPFQRVSFIFGIEMDSGYFPWVYLGFTVLLGQSFLNIVGGFLIGHLYLFIKGPIFDKTGIDFLKTPHFLKRVATLYSSVREQQIRQEMREQEDQDRLYQ